MGQRSRAQNDSPGNTMYCELDAERLNGFEQKLTQILIIVGRRTD